MDSVEPGYPIHPTGQKVHTPTDSPPSADTPVVNPCPILELPSELIEHILSYGDPVYTVAPFSRTCTVFHRLVHRSPDDHLWRTLYLAQDLDDPRTCLTPLARPRPAPHWRTALARLMRARTVAADPARCRPTELPDVLHTLLDLVANLPPSDGLSISSNLVWAAALLRRSALLDLDAEHPALAHLHTLYGATARDADPAARVASRAYTYNMRNYTWANRFGPFTDDGGARVNWPHVRAIQHVMAMHVLELQEGNTVLPMSMPFCQTVLPAGLDLDTERDWAGVEGTWVVSFAFCDHRDLLVYNHFDALIMEPAPGPLDTALFAEPDFFEAFRSFHVDMRVLGTEPDPANPGRPHIRFGGDIGGHGAMSGHVAVGADGHVRWSFVSGEHGRPLWSSEGVQVGGVRSRYGVLGAWTTTAHEPGDPVGPFWLNKLSDADGEHVGE